MDKLIKTNINLALSRFNFIRVQKVMESVNWTYADDKVPSLEDIQATAKELLTIAYNDCINNVKRDDPATENPIIISSGGFEASFHPNTNIFELKFILEESNSTIYGDEE